MGAISNNELPHFNELNRVTKVIRQNGISLYFNQVEQQRFEGREERLRS